MKKNTHITTYYKTLVFGHPFCKVFKKIYFILANYSCSIVVLLYY